MLSDAIQSCAARRMAWCGWRMRRRVRARPCTRHPSPVCAWSSSCSTCANQTYKPPIPVIRLRRNNEHTKTYTHVHKHAATTATRKEGKPFASFVYMYVWICVLCTTRVPHWRPDSLNTTYIYMYIYIHTHHTHIYTHTTHIQTLTKQHTRQDIQTTHDTLLKHTTPCRRSMLAGVQIAYTPHTYIYININTHHPRVYIYICKHTHNIQTLTQHTHTQHNTHTTYIQHTYSTHNTHNT